MKVQSQLLILCFVALLLNSRSSLGQTPTTPPTAGGSISGAQSPPRGGPEADWSRRAEAYKRGLEVEMRRRTLNSRKPDAILPVVSTEEELTADERKGLMPAPEDLKANTDFLRQRETGIFRLMRVDKQNRRKVVSADNPAVSGDVLLVGGGAQYSFTKKNHNADKWSAWDDDWFLAGVGGEAVGILVDLGNVSLESVNLESVGLGYLSAFVPAVTESAAETQFQRLEKGETHNGFKYGLSAPWKLETTYALRSVNYGRSDLLVVFRAVRQDSNGSLIVLWKKLKSYDVTKLKK